MELAYQFNAPNALQSSCFNNDLYAQIYINNKPVNTKIWSEMNLKNGDTLCVKRTSGFLPCNCGAQQFQSGFTTNSFIIKLVDNKETPISNVISGSTTICPGDTVTLGQTTATTLNYRWFRDNSSTYSFSLADTVAINAPGKYRMAQYNTPKGECPAISPEINVKKGVGCKAFIRGFVYKEGSYNTTTKKYTPIEGVTVKTDNGMVTVSDRNGEYRFQYDSIIDNQISILYVADPDYYAASSYVLTDNNFMLDVNESLLTYLLETNDLAAHLNSTRNRPGFTMPYYVSVENRGKNSVTTKVTVTLDDNLTYTSLEGENKPTTSGKTLTWENVTVASGATKHLTFYAVLDRKTALGTALVSSAKLTMATADDVPANDNTTFKTTVSGSFDPNDKLVTYVGAFTEGYVNDTTKFEYTIRFQNTGTDTAFTVRVEDVISNSLDLTTINKIDESSPSEMVISGDTVKFIFKNILLPDSNVNEPASHGFIRFAINQKMGNAPETVIKNKASIFFDFNDPVITNEVVTIVNNDIVTSIENERKTQTKGIVSAYPNPASNSISINAEGTGSFELYNAIGSKVLQTTNKENINIESLKSGVYYYQFITGSETFSGSFVKE